jgi:hypothetical protein
VLQVFLSHQRIALGCNTKTGCKSFDRLPRLLLRGIQISVACQ